MGTSSYPGEGNATKRWMPWQGGQGFPALVSNQSRNGAPESEWIEDLCTDSFCSQAGSKKSFAFSLGSTGYPEGDIDIWATLLKYLHINCLGHCS